MGCILVKADVEIGDRRFQNIKLVAKGGFSQIFLVEELKTKQEWALKRVDCHSATDTRRVRQEIDMHLRFGTHPNILALETHSEEDTPQGLRFSLVFTYYKRGSLLDELTARRKTSNHVDESVVLQVFSQIVGAVSLLHSAHPPVAHRDIKPGNILIADSSLTPVLMDFGSCCECPIYISDGKQSRLQLDEAAELCSMPYRAPELFVCEVGSTIDQSIDIWSLGCVLFALCFFRSPFEDVYEKGDSIALAVQSAKVNPPNNYPYSTMLVDAMKQMIRANPKERPNIHTVRELFQRF